jgi:hypothetical protein
MNSAQKLSFITEKMMILNSFNTALTEDTAKKYYHVFIG